METQAYNHGASWAELENVLRRNESFAAKWQRIVDFHSLQYRDISLVLPSNDALFKEHGEVAGWLLRTFTVSPIPTTVASLWFGLIEYEDDDNGEENYAVYVVGSDTYESDNAAWAFEPTFLPADRYFSIDCFNKMRAMLSEDDDSDFLNWILPLAYTALMIDDILRHDSRVPKAFNGRGPINIACGYDSGDFLSLTQINS